MNASYSLTSGNIGMLISMPHNGQLIPKHIADSMTENGHNVADTDWYIDKLYDFATCDGHLHIGSQSTVATLLT